MDLNMTLLLLVLVGIFTYIIFTPDNWLSRTLDKYCCDPSEPTGLADVEHIKIPTEKSAPPKKKRVSKRKKKAEATDTPKPKKKRKYTRRKKNGIK